MPYNEAAEQTISATSNGSGRRTSSTISRSRSIDYPFSNGVIGKLVIYNMEERQRIKIMIYTGTKEIEQTKIEERLRELSITIRLDSFVDQASEKRVANVIREMMVEKGFQDAKVEPVHRSRCPAGRSGRPGSRSTEGPKVKISKVDFVGNKVFSDGKLAAR